MHFFDDTNSTATPPDPFYFKDSTVGPEFEYVYRCDTLAPGEFYAVKHDGRYVPLAPVGIMPDLRSLRADKNGHVPPLASALDYPQKIGKPITPVRRVSVRRCLRARTRRFNR